MGTDARKINTGEAGSRNYAEGYSQGLAAGKRYGTRVAQGKAEFKPIYVPKTKMDRRYNQKPEQFRNPPSTFTRMDRKIQQRNDMVRERRTRMDQPQKVYMDSGFPNRTNNLTWVMVFWITIIILSNIFDIDAMMSPTELFDPDSDLTYAQLMVGDPSELNVLQKSWRGLMIMVDSLMNDLPFLDKFVPIFRIMTFRYEGVLPNLMGLILNIIYLITIYEFIVIVGHLRG